MNSIFLFFIPAGCFTHCLNTVVFIFLIHSSKVPALFSKNLVSGLILACHPTPTEPRTRPVALIVCLVDTNATHVW